MLIPNQFIRTKWMKQNKEHYETLGYEFTKYNKFFIVKAEDLPPESHIKVKVICDGCGMEKEMQWRDYLHYHSEEFGDLCKKCSKVKSKQTCLDRYGFEYALSVPEIRAKGRQTLYSQGNVPTSKPEQKMCKILKEIYGKENCIPWYPYQLLNFDCLLVLEGVKIDVEYDGWYWHKNKQDYDRRRNYMLTSRGFKVLRIKASYELPIEKQIREAVDYLVKGNHQYAEIILDI